MPRISQLRFAGHMEGRDERAADRRELGLCLGELLRRPFFHRHTLRPQIVERCSQRGSFTMPPGEIDPATLSISGIDTGGLAQVLGPEGMELGTQLTKFVVRSWLGRKAWRRQDARPGPRSGTCTASW